VLQDGKECFLQMFPIHWAKSRLAQAWATRRGAVSDSLPRWQPVQ